MATLILISVAVVLTVAVGAWGSGMFGEEQATRPERTTRASPPAGRLRGEAPNTRRRVVANRTRETIERAAWLALLEGVRDGDVREALRDELDQWAFGRTSPFIEVTLIGGRLESDSAPQPAWSMPEEDEQ